ncbi:MAG: D-glycero-beta-D-manno-heptose 1-phosphate adenylyltransferase [Bacteroidales bacterium]|jgi:rfaE bifunctional protein nucleotidyltransferase chain/domain|nr:D-glycero-beta-D-manno-heptose 1-phosphate adenylyltransferase [Bacteroidales bacterium]
MDKLNVIQSKIIDISKLESFLTYWNLKNQKIVFTNGCFDILHRGHVEYLAQAASNGDVLIIGLNTDSSVRRIKGETRPVQDEYARAILLASLSFVSAVVLFDDDTPYNLIKRIQPDVLIKGSDYSIKDIVGSDIVIAKGGKVITIDFVEGYSTTSIIEKLKKE